MRYLLALDQGTTSSRAFVYDASLRVLGRAQRPLQQHFPAPGLVEHDPREIWLGQRDAACAALADAGVAAGAIDGIGITNQRETVVLWNRRTGEPLHRALVWQDRRTAAACTALRESGHEPDLQRRTGLVLDPYFSASKLAWLLDHCAGARGAAAHGELAAGTIDTWLTWQLTGGRLHVTDATNASRTLLYDLARGDWDDDLLALWDIPREILPRIVDSSGILAETNALPGVRAPIAGIAGDQQAALFGQGCFAPGDAKCTYGTGCFILQQTGPRIVPSRARLLTTVASAIGGERAFAVEGSVFMGGAIVQWLRDGLGIIADANEIEPLAASVPDSGGVVLVPAFTGLGAPHWDADARGLLIGLTRGTTRAHIARAALEAIALQVHDVLVAMAQDTGAPTGELRVDGGASRNRLLMQLQADLLGRSLRQPRDLETTARGAAALAGLGVGTWRDRATLVVATRDEAAAFAPDPACDTTGLRARWEKAIVRAGHWATAE
ncbi:MAG: glycerol kinase GlpK [Gammaproteobacteria bacterium]